MKTLITLALTILFSTLCVAQNGINYKAIIKDNNGNVIANDLISVQFTILQGVAQTNVYQETHTPTTNANGLIIINIGEGTPVSGTFAAINWASDTTFLNTKINTGAGLVDMGTTEFKAVPYALNAETAANVTGLEAIDEGNGIGWRLKGRDPNNYGNIGLNAIDLSQSLSSSATKGATGDYSIAMGLNATASQLNSISIGDGTIASAEFTTAIGLNSVASGLLSTAIGAGILASGYYSTAMGFYTKSESRNSTAFGRYNVGGGHISNWIETDPLFEIGNGSGNGSRTNALTVLKNGTITAPTFDLAEITDPKALITKEYLNTNTLANKEFVSENGVTHTTHITDDFVVGSQILDFLNNSEIDNTRRMFFNKANGAFRAGTAGAWHEGGLFNRYNAWNDANVGYASFASGSDNMASGGSSTAMGISNTASGDFSTAMGTNSSATGEASFAMGNNLYGVGTLTLASGSRSVAFGNGTEASGVNSTAFGYQTTASENYSTAMGAETTASGNYSTAMGSETIASGTLSTAMGYLSNASGNHSTALGVFSTASGESSTSMGNSTSASGYSSTTMGNGTTASGFASTSMGSSTTASGYSSVAMGYNTIASSYASLVVGRYNVGGVAPNSWVATDPLFEVGFGTSSANKLNALTVTKNGRVGIGTNTPSTFLHLTNGYDASLANGSGYFIIGQETGNNLVFDNNEIMARNIGATSTLFLQNDGGNVAVGGTIVHSSDFRLKKDITQLSYGLETILELNPVEYNWKNREQEFKSLGLIAQEVQPVIENIIHTADDKDKTLSVSYTELIPVLIKAIKEQQDIINSQSSKIKILYAEAETKDEALTEIVLRLQQIESTLNINSEIDKNQTNKFVKN